MSTLDKPQSSQQRVAPPVRKNFMDWRLEDVKQAIAWVKDRRVGQRGFDQNWAFVIDKDHLQNGDGWIGPDGGKVMESRSRTKTGVERQFTAVDAIGEVLDTIANALLQNKAKITLEPLVPAEPGTDAEDAQQKEAKALLDVLTAWMDDREFTIKARDIVKRSRAFTWGVFRAWIPEAAIAPQRQEAETEAANPFSKIVGAVRRFAGLEEADKGEQQTTVALPVTLGYAEALNKIYLSAPLPDQGYVYIDPDSQRKVGIFYFMDGREEYAELTWVDDNGLTVMKTVLRGGDEDMVSHDLGGRIIVNQMEAELLVTGPVRMQQAQLNFANSLLTRVMETAGFPERYILDAMPFGSLTDTPPSDGPAILATTDESGKPWYIIPKEPNIGSGVLTQIRGYLDGTGPDAKARTPNVIKFDPTDPDYIVRAKRDARGTILRQCKQGHLEMDDQATATGWSRVQARAAHIADVTNMKEPLIALIQNTLEAVLAYAGLMSPEARSVLENYRVAVQVHINVGPVSPEERTAILEMMKEGALSLPTALVLLQVDDPEAEIQRIRSQPESQRAQLQHQVELGGLFINQWGLDAVTVADLVGLPKDMIQKIKKSVASMEAQAPPPPEVVDAQGNPLPVPNRNGGRAG